MQMSIHALLVEAPGLRLVVDTCVGNDKPRSLLRGKALSTNFLAEMEAIGWTRDSVNAVVCTHLHVDHVGWNTMLENGKWVPTFPKARYYIGRVEYEHWAADGAGEQQAILEEELVEHGWTRQPDGALTKVFGDIEARLEPGGTSVRIFCSTRSVKRVVSSIRVPVGARM